jgi:hypothetical protein
MALDDNHRKELLLAIEENRLLHEWFQHPGFKIFAEKVKALNDNAKDIRAIPGEKELNFRKGQIDILDWFLTFPTVIRDTLEYQVEEAEELVKIVRGRDKDD